MIDNPGDSKITRREFAQGLAAAATACAAGAGLTVLRPLMGEEQNGTPTEAMYYEKLANRAVKCLLCYKQCILADGERGFCRARENRAGTLISLVYGRVAGSQVVPIETGNILHFLPGTKTFAIGTASCVYRCKYCPFWKLATETPETIASLEWSANEVVQQAIVKGCATISFTLNEPTVFYEYMLDVAKAARAKKIKTVLRTNGAIRIEPLKKLLKHVDGVLAELKSFDADFYEKIVSGKLEPALDAIKVCKDAGVWLEMMSLIVPTLNDDVKMIKKMCEWIHANAGDEIPLHFCRFLPAYQLTNLPPTSVKTLEAAVAAAREAGLKYVCVTNVPAHPLSSTKCPACGKVLIRRVQVVVAENNVVEGKCKFCGAAVRGYWSTPPDTTEDAEKKE